MTDPDAGEPATDEVPEAGEPVRRDVAWPGPRPVLVGIASALLILIGAIELIVATTYATVFGTPGLVLGLPIGLLGVAAIFLSVRIRIAERWRATLGVVLATMVVGPLLIGTGLFGLVVLLASMLTVIALVHHRAWFIRPAEIRPGGSADEEP